MTRTIRTVAFLPLLLFAASGLAGAAAPTDETAALRSVERFEQAWERGDLNALLESCTEDFQSIANNGNWLRNKADQSREWSRELQAGLKLRSLERTVRSVAPAVIVVVTRYAVSAANFADGSSAPAMQSMATVNLVKQNGKWLLASIQSTPARAPQGAR